MKNLDQFENRTFSNPINVIHKQYYPVKFPKHWHKYVEIIAFIEEAPEEIEAVVNINQESFILHSYDILFVWPGELHEIVDNRGKGLMALQFPINVISEVHDLAINLNLIRSCHLMTQKNDYTFVHKILDYIQQINDIDIGNTPFAGVKMLIQVYEILQTLGSYLIEENKNRFVPTSGNNLTTEKILHACAYIQDNCENDLMLEKVAALYGFSPCYFSRCFKKVTNYNFVEYLSLQRVKKVQMLLTNTKISITDAAFQIGFRSISTFNRVFRHVSGCSPSEYKRYYTSE
ncbi:MAG: AraC family transcriptional regulator [Clostridiales bacterium]|nr:AraC family transcriptional regulator [Clostridiales bacterium]